MGDWVAERLGLEGADLGGESAQMYQPHGPVAVLDCGTNSTRLLVMDVNAVPLAREMRITRLGQGVDACRAGSPQKPWNGPCRFWSSTDG